MVEQEEKKYLNYENCGIQYQESSPKGANIG